MDGSEDRLSSAAREERPAVQLRLFPPCRPLKERLGDGFFAKVPAVPGVYLMGGEADRVLYVGQSGNLRARLNSYKNLNPDRASRKLVRLVHAVRSITWETCATVLQARLRENELLRLLQPRFNSVNTHPEQYVFVGFASGAGWVRMRVSRVPGSPEDGEWYGAFKAQGLTRRAVGALARMLWAMQHRVEESDAMPAGLLLEMPPVGARFEVGWSDVGAWVPSVREYLGGSSDALVQGLADGCAAAEGVSRFQRRFWEADLETLRAFYRVGPRRNHELGRQRGVVGGLVAPPELDDWLVWDSVQR